MKRLFFLAPIVLLLFYGCDITPQSESTSTAGESNPVTENVTTQDYLQVEYDIAKESLEHEYETKKEQIIQDFLKEKETVLALIDEWTETKANDSAEYSELKSEIKRKIASTEGVYNRMIAQADTSTEQTNLRNKCIVEVSKLNVELGEYTKIHESNQQICESNLKMLRTELADVEKREDTALKDLEEWYQTAILELKNAYNQP